MPLPRKSQAQVRRLRVLSLLADGEFHSGEQLARRLRISRAGIWKLIHTLQALGIEIESISRQGYRLPRAVDLLDRNRLLASMSQQVQQSLERVDVLLVVDSTN
ncbi:MAG TPA: HTH domain-containing protein, partial [Povalibacter sp.]|nr:HTH domain-containing protein [Povalibacter sp.]